MRSILIAGQPRDVRLVRHPVLPSIVIKPNTFPLPPGTGSLEEVRQVHACAVHATLPGDLHFDVRIST